MTVDRVQAGAAARGLEVRIIDRPAARSLPEAAELLGLAPAQLVKSLVVRRGDDDYLFALIPGDRQIAWPKLRAAVGVNRLAMPPADEALTATGYERGTITPIGALGDWPLYVDERIGGEVALGAGSHGRSALVDAAALIAAYGATVADISS
ncbi:YbaK/EbsC family protein [Tsukamurella sp. 8F]|uniref:aminoacyl-tRNA deacylase n=1 Tax=unclassified Tsukamurella TaxID=2633480 RepID=UPI0023B88E72|nr:MULTISPECIES: YbaK/EbsC family protein [unclassified Tsukamurella]MDF0532005.1 YbaK/EbsC family protein [Tsukamurella sp. 8J]MDF0588410.1 YbaK/EbsC family protein [Tsukamurella sp. 8F]